jgi:hypothetical protein
MPETPRGRKGRLQGQLQARRRSIGQRGENDDRRLAYPHFASSLEALHAVLLLESPPAFRARDLFVSANALSRV